MMKSTFLKELYSSSFPIVVRDVRFGRSRGYSSDGEELRMMRVLVFHLL